MLFMLNAHVGIEFDNTAAEISGRWWNNIGICLSRFEKENTFFWKTNLEQLACNWSVWNTHIFYILEEQNLFIQEQKKMNHSNRFNLNFIQPRAVISAI